ncbi:hypothetical protein WAI453_012333 [Rhynchosporium graminicola]
MRHGCYVYRKYLPLFQMLYHISSARLLRRAQAACKTCKKSDPCRYLERHLAIALFDDISNHSILHHINKRTGNTSSIMI